jgi:hypothetical protein
MKTAASIVMARMAPVPSRLSIVRNVTTLLIGGIVGFAVRGPGAPPANPEKHAAVGAECVASSLSKRREAAPEAAPKVKRPFLTRPQNLYVSEDAERERAYLDAQAHELVGVITRQLDTLEELSPNEGPESLVNQLYTYQAGLIDGVVRTAPELSEALAERVEETMCNGAAKPTHQLALARMVRNMPEASTERAFDCVFSRPGEDVLLWAMLDAFPATELAKPDSLLALEERTKDPRTLRRLRGHEETASESSREP